jgi:hypothetical protein
MMTLRERRLFLRALRISSSTIQLKKAKRATQPEKLFEFLANASKELNGVQLLRGLAQEIWKKAKVNCSPDEVWLDFPSTPKLGDLDNALVNIGDSEEVQLQRLGQFLPLTAWGRQYIINRWRGHVFCPPEHVQKVYKAAKDVLSDQFGLEFNRMARPRTS